MKRTLLFSFAALVLAAGFVAAQTVPAGAGGSGVGGTGVRLVIEGVEYREDPYEPGAHLEGTGYQAYDGGHLVQSLDVPRRMYTFRGEFDIPPEALQAKLGLYVGPNNYPYHLYLNGVLIGAGGRHEGGAYNSASFISRSFLLPPELLSRESNRLALQIYPLFETSPPSPMTVSSYENVAGWVFWRNFFAVYLIRGATVLALVLSAYFLVLYFARGRVEPAFLYFALVCVTFIMAYFEIIFQYASTREVFIKNVSKAGFTLVVFIVTLFVSELTGILNGKRWFTIVILAPAIAFSAVLLTRSSKEAIEATFGIVMTYVFGPVLLFNVGMLVVSLIRDKKTDSLYVLLAFVAVLAGSLHDIYYIMISVLPYAYLTAYGFVVMVIAIFLVLAKEQARLHKETREREEALAEQNREKGEMIGNVRKVAESLIQSSRRLDESVRDSAALLEENGRSNVEVAERVTGHMNHVDRVIDDLKTRVASSTARMAEAISNQTRFVEEVSTTLRQMNEHIENLVDEAHESSSVAGGLAEIATASTEVIDRSDTAVRSVGEYSSFIQEVLQAVEDVAEKTNLLSINAAIEAARAGRSGEGFAVVAGEVRKLSAESKGRLEASFGKISDMRTAISNSATFSAEVAESLRNIVLQSRRSADRIAEMTGRLGDQRRESQQILEAVEELYQDTVTIRELSEASASQDEELTRTLKELQGTFQSVEELLEDQKRRTDSLSKMMEGVHDVATENRRNVDILRSSAWE